MKSLLKYLLCFLAILVLGCSTTKKNITEPGLQSITPAEIKEVVEAIASDSMKGRSTPSTELNIAARYIADKLKSCGMQPVNNSYFQEVKLQRVNLGSSNILKITNNNSEKEFIIKDDFIPFEMTADTEVEASVVFAGYGISSKEYNYDDYENIDVKGKIVFILRHEPGEDNLHSIFDGFYNTTYSYIETKVENAIKHGVAGILICNDPLNHNYMKPVGFPWPSLSKIIPEEALPFNIVTDKKNKIPVIDVGEEVIKYLFVSIDSLKNIQKRIDEKTKPSSFIIHNTKIKLRTSLEIRNKSSKNVVGYFEGNKNKDELLVIGAHYDHIGFMKNYEQGSDFIFNGADDNASGTAGVIAIAKAFSTMKTKPERSILFILFSGEEKGLLGSQYYVSKPLFPLNKTIVMLNLDMISRNSMDSLYLEGAGKSPDITNIIKKQNKGLDFYLNLKSDEYIGGSDHAGFYYCNIPFMFFFAGMHKDYHKVSDNPDSINPAKAAKVAQLVFKTAWFIANDNKYYRVIK